MFVKGLCGPDRNVQGSGMWEAGNRHLSKAFVSGHVADGIVCWFEGQEEQKGCDALPFATNVHWVSIQFTVYFVWIIEIFGLFLSCVWFLKFLLICLFYWDSLPFCHSNSYIFFVWIIETSWRQYFNTILLFSWVFFSPWFHLPHLVNLQPWNIERKLLSNLIVLLIPIISFYNKL